jgi:hypothetical protein
MIPTYHIPTFIAVMAAILVAARFKKIVRTFIGSGTTSPGTSKTLYELSLRRGLIMKRLINSGVIIETSPERYYLHAENLAEYRKARRKRILIFAGILILLILIDVFLLNYF